MVNAEGIEQVAKEALRWPDNRKWNSKDKDMRFRAIFGAPSDTVAEIWNQIQANGGCDGLKKHLLWALVLLKSCQSEEVRCAIVGWPSRKTFHQHAWHFIELIGMLKDNLIKLDDRFNGLAGVARTDCFISVDGTDCPMFEPQPFDSKTFSHKFSGPGLKHEVAVCIKTGEIVWINGPFKGGKGDGEIFRQGLSLMLCEDEAAEVDRGCKGDKKMKTPEMGDTGQQRKMKSNVRAQHEAVNGRLKQFGVLTTHFRRGANQSLEEMMERHQLCFEAVAVITQLKTKSGATVFEDGVNCDVNYF